MHAIRSALFEFRFEILAFLMTAIIFGGGIVPKEVFDEKLLPLIICLATGLSVIIAQDRKLPLRLLFAGYALLSFLIFLARLFTDFHVEVRIISLLLFMLFLVSLSLEVFRQMIGEKDITHSIIFAAFDCYLLLGISGAMLFNLLMLADPNAFTNVSAEDSLFDKMNYFSFVTLTSIGYGDITPASQLAEKLTAFYGLIGHFYSVVIVGIIVGKYVAVRGEGS